MAGDNLGLITADCFSLAAMNESDFWALLGPIYLLGVAWPLARIDIREHRLPNRLVLPALPITLCGQVLASAVSNEWSSLLQAVVAMLVAFAIGLLLNRFATLGMGDVKLIAASSLMLGWFSPVMPLAAVFIALGAATAVVVPMLMLRRLSLGGGVALGPYLLGGVFGAFGFLPFV